MNPRVLAVKQFSMADQERFARLSGDFNPLHMDLLSARRTQMGLPLVHGIHTLLWGLEHLLAGAGHVNRLPVNRLPVNHLKVRFSKPVCVGDSVSLVEPTGGNGEIRAQLMVEETVVSTITIGLGARQEAAGPEPGAGQVDSRTPFDLSFDEIAGRSGWLEFLPSLEAATLFPAVARSVGASGIAALAGCSRLIGMVCPGLHSIFTGLDIDFVEQVSGGMRYEVASADERFRAVRQIVNGGGLRGTVDSLVRLPPIRQASMAEVSKFVAPGEFSGANVLIVGGSRGLGEITAKIIAAGGGRPVISYAAGRQEAEQVAEEIRAAGGACEILCYDVLKPAGEQLGALAIPPDRVYYFATPAIFRHQGRGFKPALFANFNLFYVQAFADLCNHLHACRPDGVRLFYPSSVAVEERPADMTEYAMSKAAGEILCSDFNRFLPGVEILVQRLPRLLTDQTVSVISTETPPAIEVMLPIVRQMQA